MNEHVFRERPDGLLDFIGNFDALYTENPDPWNQGTGSANELSKYYIASRARLIETLRRRHYRTPIKALEVGCGHGHVTRLLQTLMPWATWEGMDISAVAIAQAKAKHPGTNFWVGDITAADLPRSGAYDVVVLNQLLWYIMGRLPDAFKTSIGLLRPGGTLVICQAFLDTQRYGADIFEGFHQFQRLVAASHFARDLELVQCFHDDQAAGKYQDGLLIYRLR